MAKIINKLRKNEMFRRALKYVILFLSITMALNFIPTCQISITELLMVAIVGAVTYAILDMYLPSVSEVAKKQAAEF